MVTLQWRDFPPPSLSESNYMSTFSVLVTQ